jgi:hypothetical protein
MSFHPAGGVGLDPGLVPPPGQGVPPPPPGPGAAPPFAAPPTERDKRRMWISLGIGAVVLVLCCAGGIGAIGVVVFGGVEQSKRQATATVEAYLDAVRDGNTRGARAQVCSDLGPGVSASELVSRTSSTDFTSYSLGEAELTSTIDVPATLSTPRGEVRQLYLVGSEGTSTCIVDILAG